jgi:hypothetical protein
MHHTCSKRHVTAAVLIRLSTTFEHTYHIATDRDSLDPRDMLNASLVASIRNLNTSLLTTKMAEDNEFRRPTAEAYRVPPWHPEFKFMTEIARKFNTPY